MWNFPSISANCHLHEKNWTQYSKFKVGTSCKILKGKVQATRICLAKHVSGNVRKGRRKTSDVFGYHLLVFENCDTPRIKI